MVCATERTVSDKQITYHHGEKSTIPSTVHYAGYIEPLQAMTQHHHNSPCFSFHLTALFTVAWFFQVTEHHSLRYRYSYVTHFVDIRDYVPLPVYVGVPVQELQGGCKAEVGEHVLAYVCGAGGA